jgi:hypothetical protein
MKSRNSILSFAVIRHSAVSLFVALLFLQAAAHAELVGPTPYLSQADSPFSLSEPGFFVEDFEDDTFTPGWQATNPTRRCFGATCIADSVDADDGVIDGSGRAGASLCFGPACQATDEVSVSFSFDPVVLGSAPTHVGIVWTDGLNFGDVRGPFETTFEWFDTLGNSLGELIATNPGDDFFTGETEEDFFVGMINASGISELRILSTGAVNYTEVDHLQYGVVPVPAAVWLFGSGLLGLVGIARRKQSV